ncbi:ArsR/SmtB family transcription factor [Consotaella aegiceratis]|uniref:ArsR/SmtB family transcription factor n=1 Tax=Consotaella aegiceratis TaxID=3097961 RepID=UPI002F418116
MKPMPPNGTAEAAGSESLTGRRTRKRSGVARTSADPGLEAAEGRNFLTIGPDDGLQVLHGLASPLRLDILKCLHAHGPLNVNQVCQQLGLPQSTVASNIQVLENAGLVVTKTIKARKGHQKVCSFRYEEIVLHFTRDDAARDDEITVSMPLGLYTSCAVTAPCGLCSGQGIIGLLDVPDAFLQPERMQAALLWFGRGYVEYKFPNNARSTGGTVEAIDFSLEMSSEVPGTNTNWPSDITLWVNTIRLGTWTSPGDYGDKRGTYTPGWWKLAGSQYGQLVHWTVRSDGTFVNGAKVSDVSIADLELTRHHSIRLRIGIDDDAKHPGGLNIFGRGFGNHDQDIVMTLQIADAAAGDR